MSVAFFSSLSPRARRAAAWCIPLAILAVSLVAYGFYAHHPRTKIGRVDYADFRYVAEHFWGMRHIGVTYSDGYSREWMTYLDRVPFREILPGSYYLLVDAVERTAFPWVSTATLYALGLKFLLIGALLFFYDACRRLRGPWLAACAMAAVALPVESWYVTGRLLSEPYVRITLICAAACVVRMVTPGERKRMLWGGLLGAMFVFCVHAKSHWILLPVLLTPALILQWWRSALPWRELFPYGVFTLFVPLSLLLVHGFGWGFWHLNGGMALHVSHRTGGASFIYACDALAARDGAAPPNCARMGRNPEFFGMDVNPDVSVADLVAFDRLARAYLLRDPVALLRPVTQWMFHYSLLGKRTPFSFDPLSVFMAVLTIACWLTYFLGLLRRETAMLAFTAAILVIIASTSVIFDMANARYYFPVIGLPLALAILVAPSVWRLPVR